MSTSETPRLDAIIVKHAAFGRLDYDALNEAAEIETLCGALETELAEACDRIRDLLKGDDGQAYSEAERFLERLAK